MSEEQDELGEQLDAKENLADKMEVAVAKPEELNEDDVKALAESLVDSTFGTLNVRAEESRMKIKDTIHVWRERLKLARFPFASNIEAWSDKVADLVYKGYTRKDFIDGYQRGIAKMLNAGQLMVGRIDGRVAACIGMRKWGDHEGREVWETTKGTTLPEFRGKHLYPKLKEVAMNHLQTEHPGCPIMTVTKNPAIIGHMRKYFPGTQEIPLGSGGPIDEKLKAQIGEPEYSKMVEKHNVILWYEAASAEGPDFGRGPQLPDQV